MGETTLFNLDRLSEIAINVYNSKHGSFLRAMADAYLKADISNKALLCPVWVEFINRYDLASDFISGYDKGGGNMSAPKKWWLISDEDVHAIKAGLTGSLLHTLESGLHTTDDIPEDWREEAEV